MASEALYDPNLNRMETRNTMSNDEYQQSQANQAAAQGGDLAAAAKANAAKKKATPDPAASDVEPTPDQFKGPFGVDARAYTAAHEAWAAKQRQKALQKHGAGTPTPGPVSDLSGLVGNIMGGPQPSLEQLLPQHFQNQLMQQDPNAQLRSLISNIYGA